MYKEEYKKSEGKRYMRLFTYCRDERSRSSVEKYFQQVFAKCSERT